jgi:hypothetical protein
LPAENKASTANGPEFEPESPDPTLPDIRATFTTNLVLLAIGAIERKGLSIDQVIIEKGCRWLNQQADLTVASSLDRRTKAVLNAGAVAALIALNCDRNDQRLSEYVKNMMERAHDVYTAPQLGEMGMFLTALSARQLGNRSWLPFHQAAKYLEVSLQSPDGSYVRFPGVAREPLELESAFDNDVVSSALYSMLLTMQTQRLRRMLALSTPPEMPLRDSAGRQITNSDLANAAEDQVIQLDAAGSEQLKKLILEKLKERGKDVDASELELKAGEKSSDDD